MVVCLCVHVVLYVSLFFHVSFSFFLLLLFSLFSFIFSFIFSFSLFHCTHRDEMNQTSDSTNKERPCTTRSTESRESYQSVNPCCVTTWEVLACWVKLSHKLHSWGGAHPSMPDFHVLRCLFRPLLSQDTVYRKINDRKLFGRMSNSTHAAFCGAEDV